MIAVINNDSQVNLKASFQSNHIILLFMPKHLTLKSHKILVCISTISPLSQKLISELLNFISPSRVFNFTFVCIHVLIGWYLYVFMHASVYWGQKLMSGVFHDLNLVFWESSFLTMGLDIQLVWLQWAPGILLYLPPTTPPLAFYTGNGYQTQACILAQQVLYWDISQSLFLTF